MSKIGYIRVSTEHQETARQQEIMCDYQVDRIFSEKISGANKDRPQLRTMCGEWACRQTPFTAVSGSMKWNTGSQSRPLLECSSDEGQRPS